MNFTLLPPPPSLSESFVQKLEIKDPPTDSATILPSPPLCPSSASNPRDATLVKPQLLQDYRTPPMQSPSSATVIATSPLKYHKSQLRKLSSEAEDSNVGQLDVALTESLAEAHSRLQLTQPGEEPRLSAHHIESRIGSITHGILPTIEVVTTEPSGSLQGGKQRLGRRKEGVHRGINVAVKLDHPYSGSPWKKNGNEEQRGEEEQSGDESLEQPQPGERGDEASVSDTPQILRRSRRKAAQMIKSPHVSANSPATEGKGASPIKTRSSNRSASRGRAKRTIPTKYTSEGEDLSTSPPPAKRTRNIAQMSLTQAEEYGGGVEKSPLEWGVEEVADFIGSIPHCNCMEVFKEHVSMSRSQIRHVSSLIPRLDM